MHFKTKGVFSRAFDAEAEALAAAGGASASVLVEMTLDEYKNLLLQIQQARAAAGDGNIKNATLRREVAGLGQTLSDERGAGQEAARQVKHLMKRVENLQQAVRRWRVKAGADAPVDGKPELLKTELIRWRGELLYREHYLLPAAEKNPVLIRPAAQVVKDEGWTDRLERLYFTKRGWVAMIRGAW